MFYTNFIDTVRGCKGWLKLSRFIEIKVCLLTQQAIIKNEVYLTLFVHTTVKKDYSSDLLGPGWQSMAMMRWWVEEIKNKFILLCDNKFIASSHERIF